jgi:hypothetical protein
MEDYLFQIKKEILRAKLSKSDHHNLMKIFAKLGKEEQQSLLSLFREKPELISKINSLLKLKKESLSSGNVEKWMKIISEEEEILKSFKEK